MLINIKVPVKTKKCLKSRKSSTVFGFYVLITQKKDTLLKLQ